MWYVGVEAMGRGVGDLWLVGSAVVSILGVEDLWLVGGVVVSILGIVVENGRWYIGQILVGVDWRYRRLRVRGLHAKVTYAVRHHTQEIGSCARRKIPGNQTLRIVSQPRPEVWEGVVR